MIEEAFAGRNGGRGEANKWTWKPQAEALPRLPYLVAVVCGVVDPLPDVRLVFHRDGSHSCFGGRRRGHAELDVYMIGKSGRHFPVGAKLKVAKETVWVARSCDRKKASRG